MMKRIFRRVPKEKGQVLLIVALMTTVFLGMVAMAVDIGLFAHERQHVQDTVDAAALAGAQQIPDNLTQAKTDALTYATANNSSMTATVTFRCLVGDRDHNGLPDASDIGVVCNPGPNGSWTCSAGRCVSLCVQSEGDTCNTIVVAGSKNVPFIFARAIKINSADTGDIKAAACKGACGGPPTAPLDVVEILDRTSSMDATELADAKNAAETVLKAYNPSLQHVALGELGPNHPTNTCGSPNTGGKGIPSTDQTLGSWVPVPFSSDYVTGAATPTLNANSMIVKSINCIQNSSVGTNLGDPVKAAATYMLASGRPNVKKAIMLFTDGQANAWITPPPTPTPTPANTGYLNCSANAAVTTSSGDNNGYQTTPGNACANGSGVAQDPSSGSNTGTSCTGTDKDRHRFYNYNLSIPSGATINGIEVRLDAYIDSTASTTRRLCVDLSWDGGTTWTATQQTGSLTTLEATYTLGTASDTWGHAWTDTQFSNANFRVRVTDVANSTARTFSLDWAAVRVTYTPAPATPPVGQRGPCDYAVQNATAAKAQDIEIFTLGYGLSALNCDASSGELAISPWYNKSATQVLAAMATNSADETGCTTSAGVTQENADGDHFYCETNSAGLAAIFQQAAVAAAASPILINLP
jgi:hypothetical protein